MSLVASDTDRARIQLRGAGSELRMPSLPLGLPVRVQVQSATGECWESELTTTVVNDPDRFKAKTP